jgi:hypothetical protein
LNFERKIKEEKTLCEQAQKHNKQKSDFLAKLSHELKRAERK